MARLEVCDPSGAVILDSDDIHLGLISSGHLPLERTIERMERWAINSPTYHPNGVFDLVRGVSVTASTPLVFIRGRGVLQSIERAGGVSTYWYAHTTESTRYYAFDKMSDRGGGAKLQLLNASSIVTLDSDQTFLNIRGSSAPPGPTPQGYVYAGGATWDEPNSGHIRERSTFCEYTVNVGVPCAAALPWVRSMFHSDYMGNGATGAREGCYGRDNDIVFCAATEAGCHMNTVPVGTAGIGRFFSIPASRIPVATYIDIREYPFPYAV